MHRLTHAPAQTQRIAMALLALLGMMLLLWLFSPSYVLWSELKAPGLVGSPETHRAYFTLLQLDDPFAEIDNPSNKVIEWRLLFPVIFHTLHLPKSLFLALPWIGCMLSLWYVAWLLWRRTRDLLITAAGVTLLGSTSWFFTSTGWLTYFDSWYVLGGLILAFSPSFALVLAAALLTPWIDERVLFMLPACLVARAVMHWLDTARALPDRRQWQLAAAAALPLAGYALVRIGAVLWLDQGSRDYVASFETRSYPAGPLAWGTWMGLRLVWVPLLAVPVLVARRSRVLGVLAAVTIALELAIALVLAGDVSRSMSMLLPLGAAGVLLLATALPANRRHIVAALALGNLLLPASHVVSSFTNPIFTARYELHHLAHPPSRLDPIYYVNEAMRHYEARRFEAMADQFNLAARLTRVPEEVMLTIARLGEQERVAGQLHSAAEFYRLALNVAPPGWSERPLLENRLRELEAAMRD